jgi:hypothetical protein
VRQPKDECQKESEGRQLTATEYQSVLINALTASEGHQIWLSDPLHGRISGPILAYGVVSQDGRGVRRGFSPASPLITTKGTDSTGPRKPHTASSTLRWPGLNRSGSAAVASRSSSFSSGAPRTSPTHTRRLFALQLAHDDHPRSGLDRSLPRGEAHTYPAVSATSAPHRRRKVAGATLPSPMRPGAPDGIGPD